MLLTVHRGCLIIDGRQKKIKQRVRAQKGRRSWTSCRLSIKGVDRILSHQHDQ